MRLRLGVALLAAAVLCVTAGAARAGSALIVTGHGWGHGVGMCQLGAIGRAERGQDYKTILRHYFNGAEVFRLY